VKVFALRHLCLAIGAVYWGTAVLAPTHALAFELFGIKIFGRGKTSEAEEPIGEPQRYTVDFAVTGAEKDLEKALKGASSLWKDRDQPASGSAGLLAKARGDYQRLLAALYGQGRYGGTISILINGREAANTPPDAKLPDPASVSIAVNPGPLFLFEKASIINQAAPPASRADRVPLPQSRGFAAGEVARSGVILQAERLAVEAWRQQGHAKARIADRSVTAVHTNNTVDAVIKVDPDRKAYYGDVSVQGTQRMDPAFVAWMTGLKPGQEYDPDDLERANRRLSRLDVFRALRIQEADAIRKDGRLPLTVAVQERPPHRFGVGGSYSTLDGLGVEAYWLHRNLFGKGEKLRFDARIASNANSFAPDKLTYRLGATFIKPGVYTPDTDFVASLFGGRDVLDPYTRTGITGQVGFNRTFTDELSGRLFLNGEYAQFEDDTFGTRYFTTVSTLGAITLDTRDNKTDATEGYFVEGVAEPFYEFNYGNAAARLTAEGRAYHGFGENNRVVLAGRVKLGSLFGSTIPETAPDKLFFAGGGGSVRGYAYQSIGILQSTDQVIGGRSLLEGSAEIRARVTTNIGVVAFADAGYVGTESFPEFKGDVRVGVGGGLRYYTGLGPIRLDVATPLEPLPGDPSVAFYVGIGQAF
jgi:translocation and assembly module TamA